MTTDETPTPEAEERAAPEVEERAARHETPTPEVEERAARHETQPFLRVLTPGTTPEEVAAIVAVLSSMGSSGPAPQRPRSAWAAPSRSMRRPMSPGYHGWRLSGLPGVR